MKEPGEVSVTLRKAQPVGTTPVPSLKIVVRDTISSPEQQSRTDDVVRFYKRDAKALVRSLWTSLPGGTVNWVLVYLLRHKASELIIPYGPEALDESEKH